MFSMQNFEPESAVISASSNSALIEKYLRNTCLGQGAVLSKEPKEFQKIWHPVRCHNNLVVVGKSDISLSLEKHMNLHNVAWCCATSRNMLHKNELCVVQNVVY